MLPALLSASGLAIALSVQYVASPLAGTWLLLHLAACASMLKDGYPKVKGIVWNCALAWLVALSVSAFVFAPVVNGAAYMWILAAAPKTSRTAADVKRFTDYRPVIEAFIDNGGTTNPVGGLP